MANEAGSGMSVLANPTILFLGGVPIDLFSIGVVMTLFSLLLMAASFVVIAKRIGMNSRELGSEEATRTLLDIRRMPGDRLGVTTPGSRGQEWSVSFTIETVRQRIRARDYLSATAMTLMQLTLGTALMGFGLILGVRIGAVLFWAILGPAALFVLMGILLPILATFTDVT